jgi:hypothetical protein
MFWTSNKPEKLTSYITPCIPLRGRRRFGGAKFLLDLCWLHVWLLLLPRKQRWYVPTKCPLIFNGLHATISRKVRRRTVHEESGSYNEATGKSRSFETGGSGGSQSVVMGSMGLEVMSHCAGDGQQQFSVIKEYWSGQAVLGVSVDRIDGSYTVLFWGYWGKSPKAAVRIVKCPNLDSNWAYTGYMSEALLLELIFFIGIVVRWWWWWRDGPSWIDAG